MSQILPYFRLLLPLALVGLGCGDLLTSTCTDIGCFSETAVVITRPGGAWADGDHALDVRLDDRVHACSFTLPIPGGAPEELQGSEPVACTPELPAHFSPAVMLLPVRDPSDSCGASDAAPAPLLASCPPLEGRWQLEVHTSATPDELGVRLAFGERVLLEQSATVQHTRLQPNGPECSPVCYQATLEYRIED